MAIICIKLAQPGGPYGTTQDAVLTEITQRFKGRPKNQRQRDETMAHFCEGAPIESAMQFDTLEQAQQQVQQALGNLNRIKFMII